MLVFTDSNFAGNTTTGLFLVVVGAKTLPPNATSNVGPLSATIAQQRQTDSRWSMRCELEEVQRLTSGTQLCRCAPLFLGERERDKRRRHLLQRYRMRLPQAAKQGAVQYHGLRETQLTACEGNEEATNIVVERRAAPMRHASGMHWVNLA